MTDGYLAVKSSTTSGSMDLWHKHSKADISHTKTTCQLSSDRSTKHRSSLEYSSVTRQGQVEAILNDSCAPSSVLILIGSDRGLEKRTENFVSWRGNYSPGEQEYGRNAESHQNAHNHEDWQVTGNAGDYNRSRDEELTETRTGR